MSRFDDPRHFGRMWAAVYDEEAIFVPTAAVDFLAEFAGNGRALELAIGTGRVGLPLAARGVDVHGIEASEEMVAGLRSKPHGESIPVTIGDMADVDVEGTYELIYLVYNTFFNLTVPGKQDDCLRNVARALSRTGTFVMECYVPDPHRYEQVETRGVTEESADIEIYSHDRASQRFVSQQMRFHLDGHFEMRPHSELYRWPHELDLMAERAGLSLEARYADWHQSPFTSSSEDHISVYNRL